jgi:hypothetical protein
MKDLRDLWDLRVLKDLRVLSDLRDLSDLWDLRVLRDLRDLRDLKRMRDLRVLRLEFYKYGENMSNIAVLINIIEDISRLSHKKTFVLYDKSGHKLGHFEISDDGRAIKEFDKKGSYLGKLTRE